MSLSDIWDIIKMSTVYRKETGDASDKLMRLTRKCEGDNKRNITLRNIQETFTDPNVTEVFREFGPSNELDSMKDWVLRIIKNSSIYLPDKEVLPFAKFLTQDEVTKTTIKYPLYLHNIAYSISHLMERTPPKKKAEMAKILAENDLDKISLENICLQIGLSGIWQTACRLKMSTSFFMKQASLKIFLTTTTPKKYSWRNTSHTLLRWTDY